MRDDQHRPVVVGIDGSSAAASAIDVAATEALALGVPLRITHAYVWPIFYAVLANLPYAPSDWTPAPSVVAMVNATADRVAQRHPGLVTETSVEAGGGGSVLVDASLRASLVVVGSRGVGGLAGLLAGSVAPHLAAHAHCPVMVVRKGQPTVVDAGHVTVGLDEVAGSPAALRFACEWAQRRGAGVEALHADSGPFDHPRASAADRLDDWVREARHAFPTVDIRPVISTATATDALLAASHTARLVVIGARPHREPGDRASALARALIRHSACPVTVTHGPTRGPSGTRPAPAHDHGLRH